MHVHVRMSNSPSTTLLAQTSLAYFSPHTVSLGQAQQPQFSKVVYEASVNETSTETPRPEDGFLSVGCITDNVTYSISDPDNAGPFMIDPLSGSLSVSMDVDYEDATSYQFIVSCVNVNDTSLNDSALVMITVEPVNEFLPAIQSQQLGIIQINELTPPGTILVTGQGVDFVVTDRDDGLDGIITFSLSEISHPEFASNFELNRTTGALILNRSVDLDMEQRPPLLTIIITACDRDPPADECPNILVSILLIPSNDNFPIFSQNVYIITLAESFPVNEVITTVSCNDIDHSIGVFDSYVISDVYPNGTSATFSIDDSSGNITLEQPLDYELTTLYEIDVLCLDSDGLQDNATVLVMVTDINDNTPIVTTFFVDEIRLNDGSSIDSNVLQFQCTDMDSIQNANITYSIDTDETFDIDDVIGNVTVSAPLTLPDDIFTMDVMVTLECNDQGIPPLASNLTIFIEIYKDDSTPPIINSSSISDGFVSISEGAQIGDELVQVVATDITSPGLNYTIRNESEPGTFVINSMSGVIIVAQSLNREMIDMYTFVVVVTEERVAPGIPRSVEANITVEILDINDNNPIFSEDTYNVTHSEDFEVGDVISIVSCSDLDIEMDIDYEIIDGFPDETFPGTFVINSTDGEITLLMSLDYEFSPVYMIDIVCMDSGGLQDNTTIMVTVTDVNDNTPLITTFFDNSIQVNDQSEVGFNILQFQCTDADSNENGNVTYSIDFDSLFAVNETTGIVTVAASLILPENVFYIDGNITVDCTDQGSPPLSNSSTIFYQIYKDDSTPPLINTTIISDGFVSINESAPIGTELAQVFATDTTSPNLTYSLINQSPPGTFEIDSTSGVITVAQKLDREVIDMHTFTVAVTEIRVAPGTPQSDEIEFTVVILDSNDNPPAFSQDVYNVTQLESFPINETIAIVSCNDPDIDVKGSFSGYEISGVLPSEIPLDTFDIDDLTGNITLLKPLDYELSTMYTINLVCFDNEDMQDTARVDIYLEDVNDNDPIVITFFPDPIPVSDSEMLGVLTPNYQFQCNDSDSGENGNVTYSFSDTSTPFSIDSITGAIMVSSPLTLGSGVFLVNHSITLLCSDQGSPPHSNSTTIYLQVYKEDSTVPLIDAASISDGLASISEGAQVGDQLLQVRATDSTSPGLCFELRSENSPGTFVIDSSSGQIFVAKPLDREEIDLYRFTVVVTEVLVGPFTEPATVVRAEVEVMILDENDNQPQCNEVDIFKYVLIGNYSCNNSLEIADIMCKDPDEGRNSEIIFSTIDLPEVSDGEFTLNTTNGKVMFTGILSKNATYPITIRASDQGNPPLSTLVNIRLIVTGERRQEFTPLERLLLIIIPSVSGGLLLCACFIILCMCCCWCCRRKAAQDKYDTIIRYVNIHCMRILASMLYVPDQPSHLNLHFLCLSVRVI